MNEELFAIAPVKSPRLQWLERNGVKTHRTEMPDSSPPWIAWFEANETADGLPRDMEACGYGPLEGDAIADLARKSNLSLWDEEKGGQA